ncbi:MAG: DUF86 domain-containing protein [Ruminococcus sp.]|jgi:uncharacterized protein with HEPN domain|nr:DUF86 domain-containing protein [Ruminococcus sp.]
MYADVTKQVITKILKYCNDIEEIINEFDEDFETFSSKPKWNYSVSFALQQIGELSKHLPAEFIKETRDNIPWRVFRDMRDMYAHEYERMELSDIWHSATIDEPVIKLFCETYLKEN